MPATHWSRRLAVLIAMLHPPACRAGLCAILLVTSIAAQSVPQQPPVPQQFGGDYASLDARRQQLIARLGRALQRSHRPDIRRGRVLRLTSQGVDQDDVRRGDQRADADLVDRSIGSAAGRRPGSDRTKWKRHGDASPARRAISSSGSTCGSRVPRSTRSAGRASSTAAPTTPCFIRAIPSATGKQGGAPSIQISIALDHRRADVDVDYRSSGFPAALFNGHLTASNSDVRAGNNYDLHNNRWTGFQNWWRNFFGIRSDGRRRKTSDPVPGPRHRAPGGRTST